MNCRRVQTLLPLFVEGDLHVAAANRIESHLEWCGRCNWLADEYKESQAWLRASQPPEFDESFVENLKLDVMNRIAENKARPSLFAFLVHNWNRRQILVVAASFLIVLGMVVLYLYQQRVSNRPELISGAKPPNIEEHLPAPEHRTTVAEGAPGAGSDKRHHVSKSRNSLRSATPHSTIVARDKVSIETAKMVNDQNDSQTGIANRSRDMLRIEIQTGDPSIRIIWFAPKETDLHQSKPATD